MTPALTAWSRDGDNPLRVLIGPSPALPPPIPPLLFPPPTELLLFPELEKPAAVFGLTVAPPPCRNAVVWWDWDCWRCAAAARSTRLSPGALPEVAVDVVLVVEVESKEAEELVVSAPESDLPRTSKLKPRAERERSGRGPVGGVVVNGRSNTGRHQDQPPCFLLALDV
jgi:hypothetical protein